MGKRIHLALVSLAASVLSACGGSEGNAASAPRSNPPTAATKPTMKYTKVAPLNENGFAKVSRGAGETYAEGVIDAAGKEVIPPRTDILVNAITGRVALVQKGRDFIFVDLEKQRAAPATLDRAKGYQFAEPYSCGLALVQMNDAYSYIDALGQPCFGATYDFAESFLADRAMVKEGERYRIIDTKGALVAKLNYDQVGPYSPLRWQVTKIKGEKYRSGFVDREGKEVAPLVYDEVIFYDEELKRGLVRQGDKFGFLDERAEVVIPVRYEHAGIFGRGKARVSLNGRVFFIDPSGKEVVE